MTDDPLLHQTARLVRLWMSGLDSEPDDYDVARARDLLAWVDKVGLTIRPKDVDDETLGWEPDL